MSSQALDRLQFIVSSVPVVSLFAWIARESESELVLAYVSLGVRRAGYVERGPFGDYAPDPLSVFMAKAL